MADNADAAAPAALEEISAEVSQRICSHMNDDHGVSVYAMAKRIRELEPASTGLGGLTSARLMRVTRNGCEIRAITCQGDACHMSSLFYPFTPPLSAPGGADARKRMVDIHYQVCSPLFGRWIWSKPLIPVILGAFTILGYGTLFLGYQGMIQKLQVDWTTLNSIFVGVFGSTEIFARVVQFAFGFTVVAHVGEALYSAYHCRTVLKLPWTVTLEWFLAICATGFPVFMELLELLTVDRASREASAAKKRK
jgi:Protein of unknown function (DUF2470)/Domain of unknown function (DUF4499)